MLEESQELNPDAPFPYDAEMAKLAEMGFTDVAAMRAALLRSNGNVDHAVAILFG